MAAGGEEVGPHLPGAVPAGVGGDERVRELEGEKAKPFLRGRSQEVEKGEGGGGWGLVGVDPGAARAGSRGRRSGPPPLP